MIGNKLCFIYTAYENLLIFFSIVIHWYQSLKTFYNCNFYYILQIFVITRNWNINILKVILFLYYQHLSRL